MKHLTIARTTTAAAAALGLACAQADPLYTETFTAAPLSNAGYYTGTTVPGTGLQVTAGVVAIADAGAGHGNELNLFSGFYSPNYVLATDTGSSTVVSLAGFDLLAGYTYTLSYDYSRGFGAGGNGPFQTSLTAAFGGHAMTYNDVTGFYAGFDWQTGDLTFTQAVTQLGAHVSFTASGGGYSGMAIDNISLIGLPPAVPPTPPADPPVPAIPEPSTWALMVAGLAAAGWFAKRRR